MSMVKFNCRADSPLFEREELKDLPKTLLDRELLHLDVLLGERPENGTDPTNITQWLKENVEAWCYIYCDSSRFWIDSTSLPNASGVIVGAQRLPLRYLVDGAGLLVDGQDSTVLPGAATVFCYPIYKTRAWLTINGVPVGRTGIRDLLRDNFGVEHIYSYKFSHRPPGILSQSISFGQINTSFGTENDLNIIGWNTSQGSQTAPLVWTDSALLVASQDDLRLLDSTEGMDIRSYHMETEEVSCSKDFIFDASEIIGARKNRKFNPKLLNGDYSELRIVSPCGDSFEYDLQKIGNKTFRFLHTEPLSPDMTRSYTRLKTSELDTIYHDGTQSNHHGLVAAYDNSIPVENDQYKAMLAQQNNFIKQKEMNWDFQRRNAWMDSGLGASAGAGLGMLKGKKTAIAGGVAGAFAGSLNVFRTHRQIAHESAQLDLTLDNMRKAPSSLANANGAPILNASINSLSLSIEEYSALPQNLTQANDLMHLNGFTYNREDSIYKHINTRKYFNYIQAQLNTISGNIPAAAREDLRQRFANGIRFWHTDDIQMGLEMENYERWLENVSM